jgi:hypothetical protein
VSVEAKASDIPSTLNINDPSSCTVLLLLFGDGNLSLALILDSIAYVILSSSLISLIESYIPPKGASQCRSSPSPHRDPLKKKPSLALFYPLMLILRNSSSIAISIVPEVAWGGPTPCFWADRAWTQSTDAIQKGSAAAYGIVNIRPKILLIEMKRGL